MINSVDSDGDGLINFKEFEKMMSTGTRVCSLLIIAKLRISVSDWLHTII